MKRALFMILIATLFLAACASAAATPVASFARPAAPPNVNGAMPETQKYSTASDELAVQSGGAGAPATAPGAGPAQQRVVLKTADLAIVVKDPQAKMLEISALAERLGGFVVSSNLGQTYVGDNVKVPEGSIVIRVPAKDLDSALAEIKASVVEVQSENRNGQDVTDQYVDLQSQLKAKQAAADKLYEILQKTEKAEDTLAVFNQLTQVQSEIEVLKGQINYYDQAAALSSISVQVLAEETIQPIVIAGWQPQGVARDSVQMLINFFQGFADFLIRLVIFIIPVAAVLIVLLALLWRLLRWFWRKVFPKKTVAPPPAEPLK
jgi:hypothetical protein